MPHELKAQARKVLTKLFLPIVRRFLLKRRSQRLSKLDSSNKQGTAAARPTVEDFLNCELFAKWPLKSAKKLLSQASVIHCEAGRIAAFQGEPLRSCSVFWVMSGTLAQVPTKKETIRCAWDNPSLDSTAAPKTGPLVFPALFSRQGTGPVGPLSHAQEYVVRGLRSYQAGEFVDAALLILSAERTHSVRCQTPVTLLEIPLRIMMAMMGVQATTTKVVARTLERNWLVQSNQRPSQSAILACNPCLRGMSQASLEAVWSHLTPYVFCLGDIICQDEFTSDTIYFLMRGVAVSIGLSARTHYKQTGMSIGLHSFAASELPYQFGEERAVKAKGVCVMWGISLKAMLAQCSHKDLMISTRDAESRLEVPLPDSLAVQAALRKTVFAELSDATLGHLAAALRMRVHAPGACIVSSTTGPAKYGVIVVSGKCYTSEGNSRGKAKIEDVCHGTPMYFCESLVNVSAPLSIFAETSSIVLHGLPSRIFDVFEKQSRDCQVGTILDLANDYLATLGDRRGILRAQEVAAHRVWKHDMLEKKKKAADEASSTAAHKKTQPGGGMSSLAERQIENEVCTSLAMHLEFLHRGAQMAQRYEFFHDFERTPVDMSTGEKNHRPGACFTLDDKGNVIFQEAGVESTAAPSVSTTSHSGDAAHKKMWELLTATPQPLGPPRSAPPVTAPTTTTTSAMMIPAPPPPPLTPILGGYKRPKQPAHERTRSPDLRVPIATAGRGAAPPSSRRNPPGPNLQALRRSVNKMRDAADGFDYQSEYRSMLLKKKAYH